MADQRLVDYVKTQLRNGYSAGAIRTVLLREGYSESETNDAINQATMGTQPGQKPMQPLAPQSSDSGMGIVEKIKGSLFHPDEFFSKVRGEPLSKAFAYFAIITLIPIIVALVVIFGFIENFMLMFLPLMPTEIESLLSIVMLFGPLITLLAFFVGLIGSFINAAVVFIFAKIFSSKGSYTDTYKTVAYSATPLNVLFFLPIINIIWSIYLEIKGLSILHNISMGRAALIIFAPLIVVLVIVLLVATTFGLGAFVFDPTFNQSVFNLPVN